MISSSQNLSVTMMFTIPKFLVVVLTVFSQLLKTANAAGPWPQSPNQVYYGGGDGNSVFFKACMIWAGSDAVNDAVKQTGCTYYKEGFFISSSDKWGCCNLADCKTACAETPPYFGWMEKSLSIDRTDRNISAPQCCCEVA